MTSGVRTMSWRRVVPVTAAVAVGVLLAGCTSPKAPIESLPAAPTTATVTVTTSPSPTATTSAVASLSPGATGCSNGSTTIPAGSSVAQIGDVDGDGRPDTEFFSSDPIEYGIRTAAGGVYPTRDGLAGPATHSGWTAGLDASPGFVTVLDDGRSANLFVFEDCGWVRTKGVDGRGYSFGLNGFSDAGTGVACNDRNGGVLLEGALAVKRANGRYDIRWTQIDVSSDGRLATNGATETRWSDLAASDPRVRQANESRCGDAAIVHTDGR
jgi:hypothetical protein